MLGLIMHGNYVATSNSVDAALFEDAVVVDKGGKGGSQA